MEENKIGIFDSGVGGLTVLKELKTIIPNENFVYIGDTKNLPYGTKTKEELIKITSKIFNYFKDIKVKAVVMACNTTSAVAWQTLKDQYDFPIYPISQTVCKYFNTQDYSKIGIFATLATVNSKVYQNNLNAENKAIAPVEWVDMVENNDYKTQTAQECIKKYALLMKQFAPQKIILGCTHYPYLTDELTKYFSKDTLINPANIFAKSIVEDLKNKNLLTVTKQPGKDIFLVTANPQSFVQNAQRFYQITQQPQMLNI